MTLKQAKGLLRLIIISLSREIMIIMTTTNYGSTADAYD
jgi:hypothetical protein